MKIAFIGTHGIPASYGGAETSVEELSTRLVKRGHEVTVYGRSHTKLIKTEVYKGVKSIKIRSFKNKELDFVYRRYMSSFMASFKRFDIVHYYGNDGGLYALLPKIFGKKIIVTCDGFEWERSSYNWLTRKILRFSLDMTKLLSNKIIVDNMIVKEWLEKKYTILTEYIPYGAQIGNQCDLLVLKKYGLKEKNYFIFVGRLVEEKGIKSLIESFNKSNSVKQLVIIGNNIYDKKYEEYLKSIANKEKIRFLGAIYGNDCEELTKGAYGYITASKLEGSSPSLIQAMGFGLPVIVSNIEPNLEVIGDTGISFDIDDENSLVTKIDMLSSDESLSKEIGSTCQKRCKEKFSWEKIVRDHERVYQRSLKKKN